MKFGAVLIIALLMPVAAMAKGECDADKEKFCQGIEAKEELRACIQQHLGEMSEACKSKMEAKAKKRNEKAGEGEGTRQEDTKQ
jgi:hypothetical protein